MSRRKADQLLEQGRVSLNDQIANPGQQVEPGDSVSLNGRALKLPESTQTILMNKPVGYVCSRHGQGSRTIYDLLPAELHHLKPVGRLDKDSSGLLLLTNDGQLANQLTHPSFGKTKVYQVELAKPLEAAAQSQIEQGIKLDDGPSRLALKPLGNRQRWQVTMQEGRNRQIRRTFAAAGNTVTKLERLSFGPYQLQDLATGAWRQQNS